MTLADSSFDLNELCARADVTPRTVRYYIQQGLLPSPGTRGPGARYDQTHLDRIRLIKRLQREHLPLAEIRRRLEPGGSALDYVRAAIDKSGTRHSARVGDWLQPPAGAECRVPPLPSPESRAPMIAPSRSQWDRIELADDVELHVRRPLSREQNRLVERLLEAARRIFQEDAP